MGSPFWKTAATYSPASRAVPSARAGLTSLFGMGRGGAPRLWPPLNDKMARHAWKARQEGVRGERPRGMPARRFTRPGEPPARRRKFRAISSARLCRRRLCTCALSTSSSRTALKKRKSNLAAGFALRCLQRLSDPGLATLRCAWRHNRRARGRSGTVLSY